GANFSADDVIYTLNLIKNPVVSSPLISTWQDINVKKNGDLEIIFELPRPYSSFPFTMTFGILPNHILKDVAPDQIRNFVIENRMNVVGTGDFKFYRQDENTETGQTTWYFTGIDGRTHVKNLDIKTYADSESALVGFENGEVNAVTGLSINEIEKAQKMSDVKILQVPVDDGVFALFNNSGQFTSNKNIREALRYAVDRAELRKNQKFESEPLETPIMTGVIGEVDSLKQPDFNLEEAGKKLDEAGWVLGENGQRTKDGVQLELNVVTVKGADYEPTAEFLAESWRKLGVKVNFIAADPATFQIDYLATHNYDVLVYQLHLGADPDVSPYWLTSTAENGLNFANYKSKINDLNLTNAKTETNASKQAARYADFVKQWISDAPAIALYQPKIYYLSRSGNQSFSDDYKLVSLAYRFYDARSWSVSTGEFMITP
ncbi:MAG: ABC transporter substrate-binding protein, partial [Candidatus Nomurabacteria bacterium]|nr:ABC transporter substrate-binding protein [Candidatus Nomurabacteria bacterium]